MILGSHSMCCMVNYDMPNVNQRYFSDEEKVFFNSVKNILKQCEKSHTLNQETGVKLFFGMATEKLFEAVKKDYLWCVSIFVEHFKFNVDSKNNKKESLLICAVKNNSIKSVELLLRCGVEVFDASWNDELISQEAARHGFTRIADIFKKIESLEDSLMGGISDKEFEAVFSDKQDKEKGIFNVKIGGEELFYSVLLSEVENYTRASLLLLSGVFVRNWISGGFFEYGKGLDNDSDRIKKFFEGHAFEANARCLSKFLRWQDALSGEPDLPSELYWVMTFLKKNSNKVLWGAIGKMGRNGMHLFFHNVLFAKERIPYNEEVVRFLIDAGVDYEQKDTVNMTPIDYIECFVEKYGEALLIDEIEVIEGRDEFSKKKVRVVELLCRVKRLVKECENKRRYNLIANVEQKNYVDVNITSE